MSTVHLLTFITHSPADLHTHSHTHPHTLTLAPCSGLLDDLRMWAAPPLLSPPNLSPTRVPWGREIPGNCTLCSFDPWVLPRKSDNLLIHTKALYLKCEEHITCSNIEDLSLEIKTSLYFFYDPFFIKLYKIVPLICYTVWGRLSCFTKGDLDLFSSLSTSLTRMSAGTLLFLD